MRYVCCVIIVGLFTAPAFPQKLSVGVKAGARLTGDLQAGSQRASESKWYTLGPSVLFVLMPPLSLEFDALYKRVGTSSDYSYFGSRRTERDRSNSWEFPILARCSLLSRVPAPYLSGGYSFRTISGSGTGAVSGPYYQPSPLTYNYSTYYKNSSGLVIGGGMEINAWFLKISPEIRYTRWLNMSIKQYGGQGTFIKSTQNQIEILVGFMLPLLPRGVHQGPRRS